jgi:signal transduction histidine kinase
MNDMINVFNPQFYFFNPLSLPFFITSTIVFLIGLFFYCWRGTRYFNRCAAGLSWNAGIWIFSEGMMASSLHYLNALIWAHLQLAAIIIFPVLMFHLVTIFTGRHLERRDLIRWMYVFGAFFAFLMFHPATFIGIARSHHGVYPLAGQYLFLVVFFIAVLFAMIFLTLTRFHAEAPDAYSRRKIRLVMLIMAVSELCFIDLMAMYDQIVYPAGYVVLTGVILTIFFERLNSTFDHWESYRQQAQGVAAELARVSTQLKATEERFVESSRVAFLANLSAGILHQISQPTVAIYGFIRFLKKEMDPNDAFYRPICLIEEQSVYLKGMLDNLMEVIKHKGMLKSPVQINDSVLRSLNLIKDEMRIKNILWSTQLAENLPSVNADAIQLQQVLVNILVNAMQVLSEQPAAQEKRIVITTSCNDQERAVQINIRDTGPGMDSLMREMIFEPFYTTKSNGVGIGLSLCREIVKDHGGIIYVQAHAKEGADFCIKLPCCK